MVSAKTCGPAFPYVHDVQPQPGMVRSIKVEEGLSKREYFAAHAPEVPLLYIDKGVFAYTAIERLALLARWRWDYADAMIAGRGE